MGRQDLVTPIALGDAERDLQFVDVVE